MRVFLTGATGFVGHHILRRLKQDGHHVCVLVRPASERKLDFLKGIDVVYGDITDPEQWFDKLNGIDAVIHLVGVIREFPGQGVTFEKLHYTATFNIVKAAKTGGVKRFIHMSANTAGERGVSEYQTTKFRAERLVKESGMRWTIFRPSVIFGDPEGRMEFTSELAKIISKARVTPIFGNGQFKLDPVAVEDVTNCFAKALHTPESENSIFHLGGGHALTYSDIVQTIGKAVGKVRTKTANIPFWLVKPPVTILGRFRGFPLTVDQLNMLEMGNVCPENEYTKVFDMEPKPFIYQNLGYLGVYKKREGRKRG